MKRSLRGLATITSWPSSVSKRLAQAEWVPTSRTTREGGSASKRSRSAPGGADPALLGDLACGVQDAEPAGAVAQIESDREGVSHTASLLSVGCEPVIRVCRPRSFGPASRRLAFSSPAGTLAEIRLHHTSNRR